MVLVQVFCFLCKKYGRKCWRNLKESRHGKLLILNSMNEVNEISNLLTVLVRKYFLGRAILQRKKFKWPVHSS